MARAYTVAEVAQAVRLYCDEGLSLGEVAAALGRKGQRSGVKKLLRRYGIQPRSREEAQMLRRAQREAAVNRVVQARLTFGD